MLDNISEMKNCGIAGLNLNLFTSKNIFNNSGYEINN